MCDCLVDCGCLGVLWPSGCVVAVWGSVKPSSTELKVIKIGLPWSWDPHVTVL